MFQKIVLFNKRKICVVRGIGVIEDQKGNAKRNNTRTTEDD
jgi:hypothetical protein